MISRHVSRKLALMLIPHIEQNCSEIENLDSLVILGTSMLLTNAKNALKDAEGFLTSSYNQIHEIEVNHPENNKHVSNLEPVSLKSDELRKNLDLVATAIENLNDAIDIPEFLYIQPIQANCRQCNKSITSKTNKLNARDYFNRLIKEYLSHKDEIDSFIDKYSKSWNINRMISVDKNIIRLACLEAFYFLDIPINVAISEACLLANEFGDEKSTKFINGVLASIEKEAYSYRFKEIHGTKDKETAVCE